MGSFANAWTAACTVVCPVQAGAALASLCTVRLPMLLGEEGGHVSIVCALELL